MDRFKLLVFRGTSPTSAGSCRVGHERRGLDSQVCNDSPCADDARGLSGPSACVCLVWPLSFRLCRRSSSPGKSERKYADGSANSGSTRRLLAGFATCDPMLTLTEASCRLFRLPPVDVMDNFSNRSCFRLPSTAPRIGIFFYPNTNGLIRIVINLRTFIQQFRFAKSRRYGQDPLPRRPDPCQSKRRRQRGCVRPSSTAKTSKVGLSYHRRQGSSPHSRQA